MPTEKVGNEVQMLLNDLSELLLLLSPFVSSQSGSHGQSVEEVTVAQPQ